MFNPKCQLKLLKVSSETVRKLSRTGCKYFGKTLSSYGNQNNNKLSLNLQIIMARSETELEDIFDAFDIDSDQSLSFQEFARLCLMMKSHAAFGTANITEILQLYEQV